jgi:hypothetical protein
LPEQLRVDGLRRHIPRSETPVPPQGQGRRLT